MNAAEKRRVPHSRIVAAALLGAALLSPSAARAVNLDLVVYSSAPAAIDSNQQMVPYFSVTVTASGGTGSFGGGYFYSLGDVPPGAMTAFLVRDDNDNGVLDAPDVAIATEPFTSAPGYTPNAYFHVNSETQAPGAPMRYFYAVSFNGVPGGRNVHFGIFNEWDFYVSGNTINPLPQGFPLFSGDSLVYFKLFAKPATGGYPTPSASPRTGGFDTGVYVNVGQRVAVTVKPGDTWSTGGAPVNGNGQAPNGVLGAFNSAALTARVGAGPWFLLGQTSTVTVTSQGPLYVAANDSNTYTDNSGSLRFALSILPSTTTKVWVGGTLGFEKRADLDQNWTGGRPRDGEKAFFGSTANDCDWNIPNANLSELIVSTAFAGRTLTLTRAPYGGPNALRVSSVAVVGGGRFAFEDIQDQYGYGGHNLQVGGLLVVKDSATFELDHGQLGVRALELRNGAFLSLSSTGPFVNEVGPAFGQGEWTMYVDRGTVNVSVPLTLRNLETMTFDRAKVASFDHLFFNDFSASTSPYLRVLSPVPVSYSFRDWSSVASRSVSVDANGAAGGSQIHFYDTVGNSWGTPHTVAPGGMVFWHPDGGGSPGAIDGSLACFGTCASPSFEVFATTDPAGGESLFQGFTTVGPGPFSITGLSAPSTYFLFAFDNAGAGHAPGPLLPRGGYGHPGYFRSDPIFLPSGGNPTGKNVTIKGWGQVGGSVVNGSSQLGDIVVETWDGFPYIAASTRVAQGLASPGGTYSFDTLANDGVAHSSTVIAYVDLSGDRNWQAFEASSVTASNAFSPTEGNTITVNPAPVLAGSGSAPGGVLTLSTQAVAPGGAIGNGPDQPALKLTLANASSASSLSALKLRYAAQVPPSGVNMGVWEDNGDGLFSYADSFRGNVYLFGPSVSTGTAAFFQPVTFAPSQTKSLFITLDTFGARPSSAAVSIDTSAAFGLSAGAMASQPALYPVQTGPLSVRVGVPAQFYASPDGYGGAFTGLSVSGGQDFSFAFAGQWKVGPAEPLTGAPGQPGTTGFNTVLPAANLGELIGRLQPCPGCSSEWFRVGAATMPLSAPYGGDLVLAVNDYVDAYYDNSGSQLIDFDVSGTTTGVLTGVLTYLNATAGTGSITAYRYGVSTSSQTLNFIVANGSYPFTFSALPPGLYTLGVQHNGTTEFGTSGGAEAFLSAGATQQLDARMYAGVGTISGPINYAGVLNYGDFFVAASTSNDLTKQVVFAADYQSPTQAPYTLSNLPAPATYYVVGFRDGNFNNQPDGPEPFGYTGTPGGSLANLAAFASPVFVAPGANVTGATVTMSDTGGFTGSIAVSTAAGGVVSVVAGHGAFGAASFQAEQKVLVPVSAGGAGASAGAGVFYSLGLMRAATDYSLFAFHDKDGDGNPGPNEPTFATPANLVVSSGSMSNLDLALLTANVPPVPGRFFAVASGTASISFGWDPVPGATNYLLRRANDSLFATVSATQTVDAPLSANTSSQILKLVAANATGTGPALLLSTAVYTLAGAPVSATATAVSASGADISWGAGPNPAGTLYRVYRSTSSGGGSPRLLFSGTGTSFHDAGVAAASTYRWDVAAVNGNGIESYAVTPATAVTPAAAGDVLVGTVTYSGAQAGRFVLQASTAADFTGMRSSVTLPNLPLAPFLLPGPLGPGNYYVRGFVDVLGGGNLVPGADSGVAGPFTLAGAPNQVSFAIAKDTVPPAAPAALVAAPGFGSVSLSWVAPTKSANGSGLPDLLGYVVSRSSGVTAPFFALQSTFTPLSSTVFVDTSAKAGVASYYRVSALDFGRNVSAPSAAQLAVPSAGGSISGNIRSYTTAVNGPFRVRLTSSPAPGAPKLAEISIGTYQFTGLADGTYFLRAYRDVDGNGVENGVSEPGGTYGGLNTPYAVPVVNGNAVTLADVSVCDRTQLLPGVLQAASLTAGGCPARDKGPSNVTQLFAMPVGNGGAGSIGLGTQVNISVSDADFGDSELIVLGPDGSVAGRDNRPGGASLSFTASQAGVYLIEPTSFLPGLTGNFNIKLRLDGGFGGVAQGTITYAGSRPGVVFAQLFDAGNDGAPVAQSTRATPGFFSFPGLPDGAYRLRAFRDVNGNLVRDLGEPAGQFGFSASSPTTVFVAGGLTMPSGGLNIVMADPAVGALKGAVIYDGTNPGSIRVETGLPSCSFCGDIGTVLAKASTGAGNAYFLDFLPAATSYVLRAFVDNNGNGKADKLEPSVGEQNITVTAGATTTVSVILQDPGAAPAGGAVIRGTVSYDGSQSGTVFVGFSRDPQFNSLELVLQLPATGYFERPGVLGDATYYMTGFVDSIPDGTPELSEPDGIGGPASDPGPFLAQNPPQIYVPEFGVVDTSMTLADAPDGVVRGRVKYTGASAAPRIVVQAASFAAGEYGYSRYFETVITRSAGVTDYDYQLDNMPAGEDYYIQAFVDSNDNGRGDQGEPFNARYNVRVSSGAGAFPTYGQDVTIFESGGTGGSASAGSVRLEVSYLGAQSGPVFFRFFTNDSYSGVPFTTLSASGPAGPGNFAVTKTGLPFGVTFYIDAFRDPSGAGVFNPTFHARGPLNGEGDSVVLSQAFPDRHAFGHISDPGGGGTADVYSGRLDLPGGARYDGGAFDVAPAVIVDTNTGFGAPAPNYVALHLVTNNLGLGSMLVRYSSAGVVLHTMPFGTGTEGVKAPVVSVAGDVFVPEREEAFGGIGVSTGVIVKMGPDFTGRTDTEYPLLGDARVLAYSALNDRLYTAGAGQQSQDAKLIEVDPATMGVTATGTFTPPGGGCMFCSGPRVYGITVSPDGQYVTFVAVTNERDQGVFDLMFLARYVRSGPSLNFVAQKDITGLHLPSDGLNLESDGFGNVFASGIEKGSGLVRTYKFDSSLNQVASAQIPNVITHFEGGIGNMKVSLADGHVYEAWESTANAGDFMVVRYDNNLNLLTTRFFDGFDNAHEDFPFSVAVLDSSHVVVAGGVNVASLDSALVSFNMNAGGSTSALAPAVAVTTTQAVLGSVGYAGSLASSGTFRTVLLPAGQITPIRFATAAFGASRPYLFNNVPFGYYFVRSFLDLNGNLLAEAGEPVGWSQAGAEAFVEGSSYTVAALGLCDRRSISAGAPVTSSFSTADCLAPDREGAYQRLYTFTARRGEPVTLLLEGLGFTDTYLTLYGPTGDYLISADDGGANGDAKLSDYVIPADGLYTVAASPFAAGVTGSFRLSLLSGAGSPGSVAGRVDYNGSQGGSIVVGRFSSPSVSTSSVLERKTLANTRSFNFTGVPAGAAYYFRAFVDVNANGAPDAGEDSGIFGAFGSTVPAPVQVEVGQAVTGVNIVVAASTAASASAAYLTGQVTLAGAPTAGLILEFWSTAQFTGRPVSTRLIPTGVGAFDVSVPGGAAYFVRAFLDLDGDFVPDANEPKGVYAPRGQGAESVFAPVGASVPGVDIALAEPGLTASGAFVGEGAGALMASASGPAGALQNIDVELTAGAHGIGAGGQFGFTVPPGFPFPSGVTASNTGGATLSAVTENGPSAFVAVTGGAVASGFTVTLHWNNVYLPCQAAAYPFKLVTSQNGTATPAPLLDGSPAFTVNPGPAETVSVNPPYFTLRVGELSDPLLVETRDRCGNKVAATSAEVLELRAKAFDPVTYQFQDDSEVGFSSAPALSTASAINLGFAIGQSSRAFHAVATSTGFKFIELFSDLGAAPPATYYFGASVVPANALTNVRVATNPAGPYASTATIAQTAAGVPNQVFIDFSLGDPNQYWHVLFSSVPFKAGVTPSPVWERWGGGAPSPGELAWDGRFSPWVSGGARVPNGLYYGRVELGGGGVKDDRIQVTVNVPQFTGLVYDAAVTPNPPLSGASLRVYGPSGSYSALTASDGIYVLPGLGAGSYRLNASRADYVDAAIDVTLNASAAVTAYAPRTAGVTVSSNASGGLDVFLGRAPKLLVVPSMQVGASTFTADQWGSLQVRPSTGANSQLATLYGPMRLPAGATTFDDGGQWDPATQQFVARQQLSFNVPVGSYTVVGELQGFTRSSETVYVGADGAIVNLAAFQKKSGVTGQVFRTPNPDGFFASITAVPLSTSASAAGGFGGVFLNPGTTSAVYVLGGLEAGSYILRANAQGLSAASTGPIAVPANTDVTGVDFPAFLPGATLAGSITIGGTSTNGMSVSLNAWAPGSLNFGSTNVFTTAGVNVAVPYSIKGLDAGATYQLYVNVDNPNGAEYDVPGGFPIPVVAPQAAYNFTLTPASGAVSGLIRLPAGATDFLNAELSGVTIASLRPSEVGHSFVEVSTTLPNFKCGDGSAPAGLGYCPAGVSSATFLVTGLNTQTLDLTFFHRSSGQNLRQRLSVVNGSTTTLTADLSGAVYSISGSILNQVSNPLFDTHPELVANAPYLKPLGYPANISSSTARVVAVRQELETYGVAISTVFKESTSRVGFITSGGSFTITGVPNGAYYVRTVDLRACATCDIAVPSVGRLVSVAGAAVSSVTLTLSDGYSVAGTIALDGDVSDAAVFDVAVLNKRQEVVRSTAVYLGDTALSVFSNSAAYLFNNLPAGEFYTLVTRDRRDPVKYVARPIKFPDPALSPTGLQSSLTAQNVTMKRAGQIIGRLKDGGTGELIGASNAGLLAPNFRATAQANPWIEGGFVVAGASVAGRPVQADGYFRVGPLLPGVDYDLRLAQTSWDPSFLQGGSQNYAPVTLGGIRLSPGESRDVGVISLAQGRSITGVVKSSTTGLGLGSLKVVARPSFGDEGGLLSQTFTNNGGAYTLWVSTQLSNQFDVIAAPRDGNKASDGLVYGSAIIRNLNLLSATTANFNLNPLSGGVTGQVVVPDAATGGALAYPFGDRRGFPAAAINMQPQGVVPTNPLGDIETATDERGFFAVPGLSTGLYNLHATSLGYSVFNATASVGGGSFRLFVGSNTPSNDLAGNVLTLARGATVTGRILKSDGSAPNSTEVKGVAAANFAAGEFVIGSVETDPVARTVNAYTISGFRTGVLYDLVLISGDNGENVSFPAEGDDVSFTAAQSTATKSINLTFKPANMDCLGTARALDAARTQFGVTIDCLKPLRGETAADADLDQVLTVSTFTSANAAVTAPNGTGAFQAGTKLLSTSRKRLTAVYQKGAAETRFSVRIRAAASDLDPTTGQNFTIDKVFDFYTGLESASDARVTNINGGSLNLTPSAQDEQLGLDERGRLDLPPGCFSDTSGNTDANLTVNVTMTKGTDRQLAQTLYLKTQGYIPASLQAPESGSAYPDEVWAAMQKYRAAAAASTTTIGGANPLSSFYSIFLPLGVRHALRKRADLTMSFNTLTSTSVTQNNINVWFYNASTGKYEQESTDKRIDMVNKTITVSVDHFSTFVVLDSTPTLTSAVSFAGTDIIAASFPNPADCVAHSGILRNTSFFAGGTIPTFTGQMIRASLPPDAASRALEVNIYNLSGQKVRSMPQGDVPGGQTYYMPWNCSNDGGSTVGSGVYFGEIKWGSYRKFIKMAIIKGSGL